MNEQACPRPSRTGDSLTKNAVWLMSAKATAFVLTFLLPLLLVRRLSQTDFGLYKQVFLITNTMASALPLGFAMSAFYFFPRESERKSQVVLNILLVHLFVSGLASLAILFYPWLLAAIFNASELLEYASLIAAVVLLWTFSSWFEIVAVANGEIKLTTAFIVATNLSKALLLLGAALAFGSVRALIWAAGIQGVLQTMLLLLYLGSRFPQWWRRVDWGLMRSQLAYVLPLGCAGLLYWFQMDLHHYVVSYHFGAAAYAIYAIGCLQLPFMGILSESVGSVMIPRVSQLRKQNESREILLLTARMMAKLAAVVFPMYVFLLIFGREFISLLFTPQYLASWPIFAVSLTLIPLSIISSAYDGVLRAYPEHLPFLLKTRFVLAVPLLLGLWFGTERYGLVGAITAMVSVNAVERLILAVKVGKILKASCQDLVLLKDMGKLGVASAMAGVAAAVAHLFMAGVHPLAVLVIGGIVFALVYALSVLLVGQSILIERARGIRQVAGPSAVMGFGRD